MKSWDVKAAKPVRLLLELLDVALGLDAILETLMDDSFRLVSSICHPLSDLCVLQIITSRDVSGFRKSMRPGAGGDTGSATSVAAG
jgi:hypothetical protein